MLSGTKFRICVLSSQTAAVGIGRSDAMCQAAALHLQSGSFQKYCELMIKLGKWDKAIMVAPSVSLGYWRVLMKQKADLVQEDESTPIEELSTLLLPSGNAKHLIDLLMDRGAHDNAFAVASIENNG